MTGRVQGVGFRFSTQHTAASLGLAGWVANRIDGSVDVVAEGDERALDQFEAFLRTGPRAAHVVECRVRRGPATGVFRNFSVRG